MRAVALIVAIAAVLLVGIIVAAESGAGPPVPVIEEPSTP